MTDPAAIEYLKKTTVGYINTRWKTPPAGSNWAKALALLEPAPAPTPVPQRGSLGGMFLDWAEINAGLHLAHPYDFLILRPDARTDVAKLRAAGTKVFAYLDVAGVRDDSTGPHPTDIGIGRVRPEWLLGPTFWGGSRRLLDMGRVEYQDAFAAFAIQDDLQGYDGIFLDDVNTGMNFRGAWSGAVTKYDTDAKWNQAVESFLANVCPKLHAAGLAVMPNMASQWNDDQAMLVRWGKLAGGYFKEHYLKWKDQDAVFTGASRDWITGLHSAVVAAGVPFYAVTRGKAGLTDAQREIRTEFLKHHKPEVGGGYGWVTFETPDAGKDPWTQGWAW